MGDLAWRSWLGQCSSKRGIHHVPGMRGHSLCTSTPNNTTIVSDATLIVSFEMGALGVKFQAATTCPVPTRCDTHIRKHDFDISFLNSPNSA